MKWEGGSQHGVGRSLNYVSNPGYVVYTIYTIYATTDHIIPCCACARGVIMSGGGGGGGGGGELMH